ncbi:MAG: ATP-binding protein [Tenuifilaceae bacterium]
MAKKLSNIDLEKRISILKTIGLFADIGKKDLIQIANVLIPKKLQKDEVLFFKGDFDHTLYIIVEGCIKVHSGSLTFASFNSHQFFGEYSLLDSSPRSTSATAVESSELLGLDQKNFFEFLDKNPSMNRSMLNALVGRLRDYNVIEAELKSKNQEITKQKEELEIQRKELEALNTTKDKFFAIIAHDLKNPFSTVLGLSELLAREFETFESDKLKVFIQQIYKYSNSTYNLLENLLQWSMLQTGRMPLHPKLVNLGLIISENLDLLKGNAIQKGIKISSPKLEEYIAYVDNNMITTVVRNLLSNAIKFTPINGEIVIKVIEEGDFIKVTIKDNGVGISKQDLKNLFRIDSNPSTIGTSQEKGTGLGLIICKDFVERNGGVIGVESEPNHGSSFYFTIPKVGVEHKEILN